MQFFSPTETDLMRAAKARAEALHKASISVRADEGMALAFAVRLARCERLVEIGTLTGYSTLWLASGMEGTGAPKIWTLEKDPDHAKAAREIFAEYRSAGGATAIELIEGDARQSLEGLKPQVPVDGLFIDGNKGAYLDYLLWGEEHVKKGGLIMIDNVHLGGAVTDPNYKGKFSASVIARIKKTIEKLQDQKRYQVLELAGRDGLIFAIKLF